MKKLRQELSTGKTHIFSGNIMKSKKLSELIWVISLLSLFPAHALSVCLVQNFSEKAASLFKELKVTTMEKSSGEQIVTGPPGRIRKDVRDGILELASQSSEGRSTVVDFLINLLADKSEDALLSGRWLLAVELLGELKAAEASEALIRNLDQCGSLVCITPASTPACDALVKIGEPAIPYLIKALGYEKTVWAEAGDTLVLIGPTASRALKIALSDVNPSIRGRAAITLAQIEGQAALDLLKQAMHHERNRRAKADFAYALDYIHRYKE
jgi:HEAT repeat protein